MDEGALGIVLLVVYALACSAPVLYFAPRMPPALVAPIAATGSTILFLVTVGLMEGFSPFILIAAGGAWVVSLVTALVASMVFQWARGRRVSQEPKGGA